MKPVHRLRFSLASRILAFQLAIILGALLVGAVVSIVVERQRLNTQYEQRALTVAEGMRKAAGASFVVIAGANRIRYSHPNPALIGKPIDESPQTVLAGHTY